jgi:hypothetical protein
VTTLCLCDLVEPRTAPAGERVSPARAPPTPACITDVDSFPVSIDADSSPHAAAPPHNRSNDHD